MGHAQILVVTWPAGVACSPSSCCRMSSMLGRSWGFTVIMEKSRRCKAAEYLWGVRGRHGPAVGNGVYPAPEPHLEVVGMAMGFCTASATLSPFWKMASKGPSPNIMQYSTQPRDCSGAIRVAPHPTVWGRWGLGLCPHPNIRALIDDALAGHGEELGGTVGDGAALGGPVLQRGRGDAGLGAAGRCPPPRTGTHLHSHGLPRVGDFHAGPVHGAQVHQDRLVVLIQQHVGGLEVPAVGGGHHQAPARTPLPPTPGQGPHLCA